MSIEFIISEVSITPGIPANPNTNPPVQEVTAIQTAGATFQIKNLKLYVPGVPLSIDDNIKFLEDTKQVFKITTSWTEYRSERNNAIQKQ